MTSKLNINGTEKNGFNHWVDYVDRPYFRFWFVAVPVAFFFFAGLFRLLGWWNFKLQKVAKDAKGKVIKDKDGEAILVDSSTRASDDMAFELVAGICVTYLAIAGFVCTFGKQYGINDYEELSKNPYYGKSAFVEDHLVAPMISYQGWNILITLYMESIYSVEMIGHHLVTGGLAYLGLNPYLHYRALFFFGIAEFTNIPLTFYDVAKKLQWDKNGLGYNLSQGGFVVSFIILRMILWPYFSVQFWIDSYQLLTTGQDANGNKCHSQFVVLFFVLSNFFLTFLQFLWGKQIVSRLLALLGISGGGKKGDKGASSVKESAESKKGN